MYLSIIQLEFSQTQSEFSSVYQNSRGRSKSRGLTWGFHSIINYLPSIMTVACGLVPGEYLNVELSTTRSPWTPMTR